MKKILGILVCVVVSLTIAGSATAGIVTFDDLTLTQSFGAGVKWDVLTPNYAGLTWQIGAVDRWEVVKMDDAWRSYYAGATLHAVSGDQAAYNGGPTTFAQSLYVEDGTFNFNGAYFASWPNSNPAGAGQITVQGFLAGNLVWTLTSALSGSSWAYVDGTGNAAVDKVVFTSSANPWLMDSLDVSAVPDGGATLAILGGALVGLGALRRKFGL
jgi:hypothetical protein